MVRGFRLAERPGHPSASSILDSEKTDLGRISFLWLNGESGLFARRGWAEWRRAEWHREKHAGLGHEFFLMRMTHEIRDPTPGRRSGRDTGKSKVPSPTSKVRERQQTNRVRSGHFLNGTGPATESGRGGAQKWLKLCALLPLR
jgi:hypothetical protein